ncbi:MAG: hypothetical protein PVF73_07525, partial [Bacteroidales bacterium]
DLLPDLPQAEPGGSEEVNARGQLCRVTIHRDRKKHTVQVFLNSGHHTWCSYGIVILNGVGRFAGGRSCTPILRQPHQGYIMTNITIR